MNITKKSGKKEVSLSDEKWADPFDLSICRNGWQSTSIAVDHEMLLMLREIIKEWDELRQEDSETK